MKKLISILFIATLFIAAKPATAQIVNSATSLTGGTYGNAIDTVTNTASVKKYVIAKLSNRTVAIQAVATKISGTMGGTAFPIASNDGVNFKSIAAVGDTVTWTSSASAQTYLWTFPKVNSTTTYAPYLYYGVQFTGTGTMSASFKGSVVGRSDK
jgi:hypothetical protein